MLKKQDFLDLEGWWIALVVITNEAIYGFSKKLGVNFVETIGAVKPIHAKPSLSYGIFCASVVLFILYFMTYKIYKNVKIRNKEISFKNVIFSNMFFIFIIKYVVYSFVFILFLKVIFLIFRFIF